MKIQETVDFSQKVVVAFATSDKKYAGFLRWLMRSKFHHAFLFIYVDVMGGWMALEIDEYGVRLVPPDKVKKQYNNIECWVCSDDLSWGVVAMKSFIGRGYDWLGLVAGAVRLLFLRIFGKETTNPIHFSKRMFCSEFVSSVIQRAGVNGTEIWLPSEISPGMLYDFVENSADFKRVNFHGC